MKQTEYIASFTGKERDEETGYGYFGARYMDYELTTMWLSVDPMSDKYPGISPYGYCAWNPVKLVDPDGRDIWEVDEAGHVKRTGDDGGTKKQTIKYANGKTTSFSGKHYHSILSDLSSEKKVKKTNGQLGNLSQSEGSAQKKTAMGNLFLSLADNTDVEWSIQSYKDGKYTISTLHDGGHSPSPQTLGKEMSDLVSMIHSHPNAEPNAKSELSSMGLFTKDGTYTTHWYTEPRSDYSVRYFNYPESVNYSVYMKKCLALKNVDTIVNPNDKRGGLSTWGEGPCVTWLRTGVWCRRCGHDWYGGMRRGGWPDCPIVGLPGWIRQGLTIPRGGQR